MVRECLDRILIGQSDDGAESHIADMHDVMPHFYEHLRTGVVPDGIDVDRSSFLLPNAVRSVNWCHIMDWILRMALQANPFYIPFVRDDKVLSHFLAARGHRKVLKKNLLRLGRPDLAKTMVKFGGKFAGWRWTTLWKSMKEKRCVKEALQLGFDPGLFRGRGPELSHVCRIMDNVDNYWERLDFFWIVVGMWYLLRAWGVACPCHEAECIEVAKKKKVFVCPDSRKSERHPELKAKLQATLVDWSQAALAMPQSIEPGLFAAGSTSARSLIYYVDLKIFKMLSIWPSWVWFIRDPEQMRLAMADYVAEVATP